jgi:hypothetical protein
LKKTLIRQIIRIKNTALALAASAILVADRRLLGAGGRRSAVGACADLVPVGADDALGVAAAAQAVRLAGRLLALVRGADAGLLTVGRLFAHLAGVADFFALATVGLVGEAVAFLLVGHGVLDTNLVLGAADAAPTSAQITYSITRSSHTKCL